ncbi:MAG: hypothetical protein H0X59_04280 [Chloroflexi bacterium]|nr:hypothetical protein [Chloroflexota bacterium]MDQ3408186.1 hypothetical protein [Chloroflexota bacterium]
MSDPRIDDTNTTTREPSFEDLESDEAQPTSEEAMATTAVAAAQGGTSTTTSAGPAAIVAAAPGEALNVGDSRAGDSVGDRERSVGESDRLARDPGDLSDSDEDSI